MPRRKQRNEGPAEFRYRRSPRVGFSPEYHEAMRKIRERLEKDENDGQQSTSDE